MFLLLCSVDLCLCSRVDPYLHTKHRHCEREEMYLLRGCEQVGVRFKLQSSGSARVVLCLDYCVLGSLVYKFGGRCSRM